MFTNALASPCSNYVPISAFKESRGPLLRASFSHQDIADWPALAAANHEHLAQFEREHLVIRQGRQLIVCVDALADAIAIPLSSEADPPAHPEKKTH
jgi:hypothetical protein